VLPIVWRNEKQLCLLLERFPKSVKRFFDKKRGKQGKLEHHFDWV